MCRFSLLLYNTLEEIYKVESHLKNLKNEKNFKENVLKNECESNATLANVSIFINVVPSAENPTGFCSILNIKRIVLRSLILSISYQFEHQTASKTL